jgi:hypothetical protein
MTTTMVRRACGAALVAALALGVTVPVLADTGGKQLTKKQWIKAADKICSDTDDQIDALRPPTADPTSSKPLTDAEFADIEEYVQSAYDYSKDAYADLKALRPPKKDAAKVRKILQALDANLDKIGAALRAARKGDQEGIVTALTDSEELSADFEAAAKAYGSTCGASGET